MDELLLALSLLAMSGHGVPVVRVKGFAPSGAEARCPQSAAARKIAREVVETFGREAMERAEPRIARLIEEYGDDVARVLRRTGPPGVHALETYGAAGLRILSKWGDDGARLLAAEGREAVEVLARYGEEAVELMIRHPGVGRDLLGHFGEMALRSRLSTESVVALNRLAQPIKASGRPAEIFGVIERFGDRACDFIWRNKGTIFLTAVLAAFLADPQPYIEGVKQLVVQPTSQAAQEAVRRTNWTLVVILALIAALTAWWARRWLRARQGCSLTRAGDPP